MIDQPLHTLYCGKTGGILELNLNRLTETPENKKRVEVLDTDSLLCLPHADEVVLNGLHDLLGEVEGGETAGGEVPPQSVQDLTSNPTSNLCKRLADEVWPDLPPRLASPSPGCHSATWSDPRKSPDRGCQCRIQASGTGSRTPASAR